MADKGPLPKASASLADASGTQILQSTSHHKAYSQAARPCVFFTVGFSLPEVDEPPGQVQQAAAGSNFGLAGSRRPNIDGLFARKVVVHETHGTLHSSSSTYQCGHPLPLSNNTVIWADLGSPWLRRTPSNPAGGASSIRHSLLGDAASATRGVATVGFKTLLAEALACRDGALLKTLNATLPLEGVGGVVLQGSWAASVSGAAAFDRPDSSNSGPTKQAAMAGTATFVTPPGTPIALFSRPPSTGGSPPRAAAPNTPAAARLVAPHAMLQGHVHATFVAASRQAQAWRATQTNAEQQSAAAIGTRSSSPTAEHMRESYGHCIVPTDKPEQQQQWPCSQQELDRRALLQAVHENDLFGTCFFENPFFVEAIVFDDGGAYHCQAMRAAGLEPPMAADAASCNGVAGAAREQQRQLRTSEQARPLQRCTIQDLDGGFPVCGLSSSDVLPGTIPRTADGADQPASGAEGASTSTPALCFGMSPIKEGTACVEASVEPNLSQPPSPGHGQAARAPATPPTMEGTAVVPAEASSACGGDGPSSGASQDMATPLTQSQLQPCHAGEVTAAEPSANQPPAAAAQALPPSPAPRAVDRTAAPTPCSSPAPSIAGSPASRALKRGTTAPAASPATPPNTHAASPLAAHSHPGKPSSSGRTMSSAGAGAAAVSSPAPMRSLHSLSCQRAAQASMRPLGSGSMALHTVAGSAAPALPLQRPGYMGATASSRSKVTAK